MKKGILSLLIVLTVLSTVFASCTGTPAQTEPLTETLSEQPGTTVTAADEADTESPETIGTTAEVIEDPEPSPYGMFTYDGNKINVNVSSPHAILIDANTNEILYINGDPQQRIYPASTTKLLSILIAVKNCELDAVFTPGDELSLVASDASIAYVRKNHQLTLEMLIEGMLLPSGNDAAYVVAAGIGRRLAKNEALSGTDAVSVFVEEMNRYAKEELGLQNSHFTCPDGYHNDDHYTTLIDIMTIAAHAAEEPVIMKYASLASDNVRYASGHTNTWNNSNQLVIPDSPYFYENATGLKTGTTDEAGCCLISTASLGAKKVIAGVFGATKSSDRFNDSKALLMMGMAH